MSYAVIAAAKLTQAAAVGSVKKVQRYIDRGSDVNALNSEGWAPIHYAVRTCVTLLEFPSLKPPISVSH